MHSRDRNLEQPAEDLLAPQTQIVADRETYLGQQQHDIGRRISGDQLELFISSDVAGALQQEFARHAPQFIAVHDVGTAASLRLVSSLADAAKSKVQTLTVRRQGQGVALAVVQFVEVPPNDGATVRVYATDLNADNDTRTQVARVLMAYSRLAVLLVGTLPPHALSSQLAPLGEALRTGPWPNRDLLMVPLGSGTALAAQGTLLAGNSGVRVQVTPHANKPRQVWSFIGGAWNRLLQHTPGADDGALPGRMSAQGMGPAAVADGEAATQSMTLQEMREPAAVSTRSGPMPMLMPLPMPLAGPGATPWQAYAERCARIKGAISCCVFDSHSNQPLAQAGTMPPPERMAHQGAALLSAMHEAARVLGLRGPLGEASITFAAHHLLLRPVPGHPGVVVHLVVSAGAGELSLARVQLERTAPPA